MLCGLILISLLIANMHSAVFYVFFVLLLPYFAEYLIAYLRDFHFVYKFRIKRIRNSIEKAVKKEKDTQEIETLQAKLIQTEEKFEKFKEKSKYKEENPYKIKIVKKDAIKWLLLITIICFAMGLLTPLGNEPYTHIFKLMSGNTTASISEHQPLVLYGHTGATIVLILLFAVLIFTDVKITLKDGFMLAGLIFLTFMARRQFSLLVVIGGLSITKIIADLIDKHDRDGIEEFTKLMVTWQGMALAIIITILASFCMIKDTLNDDYVNLTQYPVELADFILTSNTNDILDIENMKLYNDYNYGSYLLFRGIPVFIDSRADLYSPEFNDGCYIFDDYMDISNLSTYYEDKFEEYDITHVITYKNSKIDMLLSRDNKYKELYSDKDFIFYERLSNVAEEVYN